MRFKRNIMIAFVCYTTNCFLGLTPILASVYFLFRDTNNNILVLLFLILIFMTPIFILDIICLIIAFIVQIFMKTTYYVNDDCLVIKTKNESREIKYSEIAGITYYDYVYLGRWGFDLSKLQFVLFDKDNKQLLSIDHPSKIMVHLIIKKCKHVKVKYCNNKKTTFLTLIIVNFIFLEFFIFIFILTKLFPQ